ncbi:endonuclease/exonuclease/phosphatase family protein [Nocardioides dilutus]
MKRLFFWLVVAGLALPAVPLTLNRLVDAEAGPAVRMMSFTPLATPWYAADVLLVGIALVAGRAGPRRVVAPVLAVLVAGLGLHLWWLAPQFVGDNPAPADGAAPLVVMTTNFYEGEADAAGALRAAEARDVGLLVVNEITFATLAQLEEAGIDELLPHRIGEPNGAVDGTMVFSREPLGEPTRLSTIFQSWQVTVGEGDDALTLLAVHPRAPVPPTGAPTWLAEHATLLAAAEESGADLVLGDFNATSDHVTMRAWRDAGYRDTLELVNAGWSPTWPSNGITPAPGIHPPALIRIDHVLVGPAVAVTESSTVDLPGTDHRAVVATVALR